MIIGKVVKGVGEVVLRVNNIASCTDFYKNVIGLEVMREGSDFAFFKIADGYKGHTQALAIFASSDSNNFDEPLEEVHEKKGNLHHFALEIDLENYDPILEKFKDLGLQYRLETFSWVQWRSIFIKDPENNVVEFVCYDKSITKT